MTKLAKIANVIGALKRQLSELLTTVKFLKAPDAASCWVSAARKECLSKNASPNHEPDR
jgi:hypothetical protein